MVRGLGKLKTRVDLQRNMKRAGCVGGGVGRSVMLKGRNTRCCCPKAVWCKDSTTGKTRLVAAGECGPGILDPLTIVFVGRVADKTTTTAAAAALLASLTVTNGFGPADTAFAHDEDWIRVTITSDEELKGPPTVEFFVNAVAGSGTTTIIENKAGFEYEAIYEIAAVGGTGGGSDAAGPITYKVSNATSKKGEKVATAVTAGGVTADFTGPLFPNTTTVAGDGTDATDFIFTAAAGTAAGVTKGALVQGNTITATVIADSADIDVNSSTMTVSNTGVADIICPKPTLAGNTITFVYEVGAPVTFTSGNKPEFLIHIRDKALNTMKHPAGTVDATGTANGGKRLGNAGQAAGSRQAFVGVHTSVQTELDLYAYV